MASSGPVSRALLPCIVARTAGDDAQLGDCGTPKGYLQRAITPEPSAPEGDQGSVGTFGWRVLPPAAVLLERRDGLATAVSRKQPPRDGADVKKRL